MKIKTEPQLKKEVFKVVRGCPVIDIHTHLYAPAFGPLLLKGIDESLTYHYLVAEAFRWLDMPYEKFWALGKSKQAELIWKTLFLEHSPVSEACQGVLTGLKALGLDPGKRSLEFIRKKQAALDVETSVSRVFEAAGVKQVVMTNDPFDETERACWTKGVKKDTRFKTALRLDSLLLGFDQARPRLKSWGYATGEDAGNKELGEVRRFLNDWTVRVDPLYLMASFPPTFAYPEASATGRLLDSVVLPYCQETGLPFALMLGVKRAVNPDLRLAGDAVEAVSLRGLERLCRAWPRVKFMATVLSRENQHELVVLARKFRNLFVFGCWWFTNIPSLTEEITRLRLELLGLSFAPQHSDARVLDQLAYKWPHFREVLAAVLFDKYNSLRKTRWVITSEEIRRDVEGLLGGNFWEFLKRKI